MSNTAISFIEDHLDNTIKAHQDSKALSEQIMQASDILISAIEKGCKIAILGNGGSASDASHMAAELVGRFVNPKRRPLPAVALTTDSSIITAIANDFTFEDIFVKQCQALIKPGDVVFAISTSGNSENIVRALEECAKLGSVTILLTGKDGGRGALLSNLSIKVPANSTATIQEVHRTIIHIICSIVDDYYAK